MRYSRAMAVLSVAIGAVASVAACSGDAPVMAEASIPFQLSVDKPTVVVPRTYNAFVRFRVQRDDARRGPVSLVITGMPSFVSTVLVPSVLGASTDSSKLTVDVGPDAPFGTYQFDVTASTNGEKPQTVRVELVVPVPTLSMKWVDTETVQYIHGNAPENNVIQLVGGNGFHGAVMLRLSGVPAGVRPSWFEKVLQPDVRSAAVGFSASTVAPGTYPITVTASGVDIATVSSTLLLRIEPDPRGMRATLASAY